MQQNLMFGRCFETSTAAHLQASQGVIVAIIKASKEGVLLGAERSATLWDGVHVGFQLEVSNSRAEAYNQHRRPKKTVHNEALLVSPRDR